MDSDSGLHMAKEHAHARLQCLGDWQDNVLHNIHKRKHRNKREYKAWSSDQRERSRPGLATSKADWLVANEIGKLDRKHGTWRVKAWV